MGTISKLLTTQVHSIFVLQVDFEDDGGKETKINVGIYLVEAFVVNAKVLKLAKTSEASVDVHSVDVLELEVVNVGVVASKENVL